MSTRAIHSLSAALGLVVAGCTAIAPSPTAAPAVETPATTVPLAAPFQLRIGESVSIADALTLTLVAVQNDSRCPMDVECFWEGSAEAVVEVVLSEGGRDTLVLTLLGQNHTTAESEARIGDYLVRFTALDPYPSTSKPIPESGYVVTLVVEQATASGSGYIPVSGDNFDGVILPEQDASALAGSADGHWTPAPEDVLALEAGLAVFLREAAADRSPDLWEKQVTYKRQYAGIVSEGRRLIYANFFCGEKTADWQHAPVVVLDGGDCFFQLTYDVESRTYQSLTINGEA